MAEVRSKRTSYPSRQKRFGPAPLASFEDLSDEIPSPEVSPEESTAEARDAFELTSDLKFELPTGNETEDDVRTFSDGITPSTPRVLAQTPSTPLVFQDFSTAGSPDIPLGRSTSVLSGFDASSPNDVSSPKLLEDPYNIFSPRNSPLLERRPINFNVDVVQEKYSIISQIIDPAAERALAASADENADSLSIIDGSSGKHQTILSSGTGSSRSRPGSGGTGSGSRIGSATPSPRSARKLFSMSFFKSREDRSPSPIASPKSPLKLSPMASPKSPRKSSPFGLSLFRSHVKDDVGDQSPSSSPPTRKKSHFPSFLRGKEAVKSPVQDMGKSKDGKHSPGMFSSLFRRDHKDGSKTGDGKTPEEEEWISFSRSQKFKAINQEGAIQRDFADDAVASTSSPVELYHGGIYINIFERQSPPSSPQINIEHEPDDEQLDGDGILPDSHDEVNTFPSSQDIVSICAPPDEYNPLLRLGLSPSTDEAIEDVKQVESEVVIEQLATASTGEEKVEIASIAEKLSLLEKVSPESEKDASESETAIALKFVKPDEPETEILLREDSFEIENDSLTNSALTQLAESERENDLSEISKRRERIAKFQPHPVDRPRSILPVNYSSFEEYVNFVSNTPSASVSSDTSTNLADGILDSKAKLKVTLPRDEFQLRQRQSRKALFKSWVEFCEVGLQSPRSRRRHLSDRSCRSPSSMPASRTTTLEEDGERRTESLDYTLIGAGCEVWTTFEATHSVVRHTREVSLESDVFAITNSGSKIDSSNFTDSVSSLKSPPTDSSPFVYSFEPPSDSSLESSPKESAGNRDSLDFLISLGDEEVEPLVKEILSRDVSRELSMEEATGDTTSYAATNMAPSVIPAQRVDDDLWWSYDDHPCVSIAKQQLSEFDILKSQAEVTIPETNGKDIGTKDEQDSP